VDWIPDTANLARQGPLFWAWCAAVALGTALVAARVHRLRATGRAAVPPALPTEARQETGPASIPRVPAVRAAPAPELLARLAGLADRLDRLSVLLAELDTPAAGPGTAPAAPAPADSPLKEAGNGVEYVFRAAGG